jgi:probable phosphoglycerate mutase
MSLDIYLLRHGETGWNLEGRLQGRLDSSLTEMGRRQAQQLGDLLASQFPETTLPPFQVSPLGRAQETANLMRARHGTTGHATTSFVTEPRLTEVSFGDWEGLTFDDIENDWADLIDAYDDLDWLFEAPAGEGFDDALTRVDSWLQDQSATTVAITHGLTAQVICGAYLGLSRAEISAFTVEHGVIYRLHDGKIEPIRA